MPAEVVGATELADRMKRVRRSIDRSVKEILTNAARRWSEPAVKRLAPGRVKGLVRAGSTTRTAYVEVQKGAAAARLFPGPKGRDVPALLEFGGTRRDPLKPSNAQALSTPHGVFGAVYGARRYTGQAFLRKGAEQSTPAVLKETSVGIDRLFEKERIDVD